MEDTLKFPELDAFTPTGEFPEFLPDAYRNVASKIKDRISSGKLAMVVADTLPVQIDIFKGGSPPAMSASGRSRWATSP